MQLALIPLQHLHYSFINHFLLANRKRKPELLSFDDNLSAMNLKNQLKKCRSVTRAREKEKDTDAEDRAVRRTKVFTFLKVGTC